MAEDLSKQEQLRFSEVEDKLLSAMLAFSNGEVTTNWERVAINCKYKDGTVAKKRWSQIKKKKGLGTATIGSMWDLTSVEARLFSAMLASGDGDIETDWAKVATTCDYKDGAVAKKRWSQIKKKKGIGATVSVRAETVAPKKRGSVELEEEVDKEDDEKGHGASPPKKMKIETGHDSPELKVKDELFEDNEATGGQYYGGEISVKTEVN